MSETIQQDEIKQKSMLRLIFTHEDGGVLIGKNGRHITKLKETTSASWFVSRSSDGADRLVVLRGSIEELSNAVFALAQHLGEQADQSRLSESSTQFPTLRFLFPTKCIGSILGLGGANIAKIRADLDVSWLHVFHNAIPFSSERIVEVSGSEASLQAVTSWLLQTTMPELVDLQQTSTVYCPTKNGLRQMQLQERQRASCDQHSRHTSSSVVQVDKERLSRKRSHSSLEVDSYRPTAVHRDADRKRPRRSSDNSSTRSTKHHSPSTRPERYVHSPRHSYTDSNRHVSSEQQEKLVVPDSIAGRLIGRSGNHLSSLKERSGAQIELSPRVPNMQDRVVTVSGRPSQVSSACKLIRDSIRSFEDLET
ncbi:Poly(rC)-binding protein 2 [Coemansia sp. RSA 355]|nr:Poly(rC)-binding protein 2 [Coemansia sp. RSA 355]